MKMSSTNGTNNTNYTGNLYTIYPGSIPTHGNVNYGFYSSHPLAPPPKYEDVISGNYMYMSQTSVHPQSTLADVSNNQHVNPSEINNFQSLQCESDSQPVYKEEKLHVFGIVFFVLILVGIFLCKPMEQHLMPPSGFPLTHHQQETNQTDVIVVAPASKVTSNNRKLLLIFVISFVAGFVTILLWKLGAK